MTRITDTRSTTYRLGADVVELIEILLPLLTAELRVNLSRADVVRLAVRQLAERRLPKEGKS